MAAADKVDPIHQFHINKIIPIEFGGYDLSFTNSSLFMVATVLVASLFLYLATSGRHLIPSRWQSSAEMTYEFVGSMLKDSAGSQGMRSSCWTRQRSRWLMPSFWRSGPIRCCS